MKKNQFIPYVYADDVINEVVNKTSLSNPSKCVRVELHRKAFANEFGQVFDFTYYVVVKRLIGSSEYVERSPEYLTVKFGLCEFTKCVEDYALF